MCVTQVNRAKSIFRLPEGLTFFTSRNTLLFICSSIEKLFKKERKICSRTKFSYTQLESGFYRKTFN